MAEETFCGCIKLRTGCLIIGYFQLVGEIMAFGLCGYVILFDGLINVQNKEDIALAPTLVIVAYIVMGFVAISSIFTALLLGGVHKNKPGCVKAYIVYATVMLVMSTLSFFRSLATLDLFTILQQILVTAINIYFLMIVKRYRTKMVEETSAPEIQCKV